MTAVDHVAEPPAGVLDGQRRALTIGLLMVISLVAFETIAVATALPTAIEEIGGLPLYGWSFSAFMLASLVTTIAAGERADRTGPAVPFLAGAVLFGCGLVVAGSAPVMLVFIAGRALQGAGAGAIASMAYVCITRAYPDAIRARMFALLSSAWVLPSLVGPAVAGALAEWATWRLVFLGLFPLFIFAVTLTLPALRRMAITASEGPMDRRLLLALRLALGTGLLLAGLDLGNVFVAAAGVALGVLLAGPALLRLMPPGTLTVRAGLPAGMAVNAFLNFGFFGAEAFVPLGLTSLHGLSTGLAGVPLTAAAITWTAGSWLQARLDARDAGRERQHRVTAGFVFVAAGIAITAISVVNDQVPVLMASAGWAVAGLGMGLAYPTISLLVLVQAPSGQEGNIAGSLRMAELLSVALGAGLGGAVIALGHRMAWAEHTGLSVAFILALAVALLGCVASRRLSVQSDT